MPANTILVPGILARGSLMYSLKMLSFQVIPEFLLPSVAPALRPSSPLSSGPTLFFAPSPTEWQGRHFLNDCSPAATSCAEAAAVEAASAIAARTARLITRVPFPGTISRRAPQPDGPPVDQNSRFAWRVRQWLSKQRVFRVRRSPLLSPRSHAK